MPILEAVSLINFDICLNNRLFTAIKAVLMASADVFDENQVLQRLKSGDVSAFDAIYWQYHGAIFRNILRLTKDEAVAADISQDVFVKFWEKRETLQPGKSIGGLLFVISYHLAVNHNKQTLRERSARNELALLPVGGEDEQATQLEHQHRLLEQAVATLTEQKRLVFTRCKLEGKSYEEVAGELGISKHTVKEHLSFAMKTVKNYILDHGHSMVAIGIAAFLDQWGQ